MLANVQLSKWVGRVGGGMAGGSSRTTHAACVQMGNNTIQDIYTIHSTFVEVAPFFLCKQLTIQPMLLSLSEG